MKDTTQRGINFNNGKLTINKKNIKKNLLALLVGLIIGFVLIEVSFRVVYAVNGKDPIFWDADKRCIYRWIQHMESKSSKSLFQDTNMYEYDSILGWKTQGNLTNKSMPTTFFGQIKGTYLVSTNSRGIRGKKEYNYSRKPGFNRIVIVGDSYTFGSQVNDEFVYPYILEQLLAKTEVINMGVGAYGTDHMYLSFIGEGIKYNPDTLLFGIWTGDIMRTVNRCANYFKPKFEIKDNDLVLTNVPVPPPEQVLKMKYKTYFHSYFIDSMLSKLFIKNPNPKKAEEGREITEKLLVKLQTLSKEKGFDLIVLILPREVPIEHEENINDGIVEFMAKERIGFLDLRQTMYNFRTKNPNIPLWFSHFTPIGNEFVARSIVDVLVNEGEG